MSVFSLAKKFKINNPETLLVAFLVILGMIAAVNNYGFTDDYPLLWGRLTGHFDWSTYFSQARPVLGIATWLEFGAIRHIQSLWMLHALAVLLMGILAREIYLYFEMYNKNKSLIIPVAVGGILLSPGLLLMTSWGGLSVVPFFFWLAVKASRTLENKTGKPIYKLIANWSMIICGLTYQPLVIIFFLLPIIGTILSILSGNQSATENLILNYKQRIKNVGLSGLFLII